MGLLRYCFEGENQILVYQFATKGSLHDNLHGKYHIFFSFLEVYLLDPLIMRLQFFLIISYIVEPQGIFLDKVWFIYLNV